MHTTDCPSATELGLLIDGKARGSDRRRWFSHLSECFDCRTVLGEAATYVEEVSGGDKTGPWWTAVRFPALAASAAVLLLAVAVVLDPMGWRGTGAHTIDHISTSTATARLLRSESVTYSEHRWVVNDRGLGFSQVLGRRERALRAGVYLVDFRISRHEGRTEATRQLIEELETLSAVTLAPDSGIDGIESDVRSSLDGVFLSLGIWSESARLAAAVNATEHFEDDRFRDGLLAFRELELRAPVRARLAAIEDGLAKSDTSRIQRELRQLILLY